MLLWVDIETTGLNPVTNAVLEVGWGITYEHLEWLVEPKSRLVTHHVSVADLRGTAAEVVQEMHDQSTLWHDMEISDSLRLEDIEDEILKDIQSVDDHVIYLAGASVHFDRSFLEPKMPRLFKKVHHRHYDVSTLKMFFESLGVLELHPSIPVHRAAQDIRDEVTSAGNYWGSMMDTLDIMAMLGIVKRED